MLAVWLKALTLFLIAALFAVLAASLADQTGEVIVRWLGWELRTSVATLIALLGIFLLLFLMLRPLLKLFFAIVGGLFNRGGS